MSADPDAWREGHRLLAERVARLPAVVRESAALPEPALPFAPDAVRRFVATGVGSSEAHARLLVHLLAERLGLDARYLPPSALEAGGGCARPDDVLVVVSQGLSPTARFALTEPYRWRAVVVITAVDRDPLLAAATLVVHFPGAGEYGTLVRVTGPMAGYLAAYRLARAVGVRLGRADALPPLDADVLAARVAQAAERLPEMDLGPPDMPLAFVTSGTYGDLTCNLRFKVLEGMLRPMPPAWDLLHVAHGPFQQAFPGRATFLALTRADAGGEGELLGRLAAMLDPARHRLVRLVATLPGALAILEHEALLDALLLRDIAARHVDQVRWPGRGREAPLYELDRSPAGRRLVALTWRELEALLARGCRTAVVPLGSTEQHGPHLPFATDTWIAAALAEGFCARVDDAIQAPAVALGCSAEHMAFPGTLDLDPATLAAVLRDVLRSLRGHGFERAFVFSAHGGNYALLREALPALRAAAAPMAVLAFTDLAALTAALHREGAARGVPSEIAGHHAGEIETSILLALRPAAVRMAALAPGLLATPRDAQTLFYPSLREHAESGTVGDPRSADAARGARYLETWVDVLVDAYRREKNCA
jgi:creatinine amidohydrolase